MNSPENRLPALSEYLEFRRGADLDEDLDQAVSWRPVTAAEILKAVGK